MIKPKTIDIEDSNIAGLGSDLDREVKKAAAETEEAWKGAGADIGMQIWRIEKFKVVHWPKEKYGTFCKGDSYILLNTYEKPDADEKKVVAMVGGKMTSTSKKPLAWDVHFWLGSETSQDEAGTAAYKTVELDTLLDDAPVQHREVEGYESDLFLSYFPEGLNLIEGGVDSGFNKLKPEDFKPKLFLVKGKGKSVVVQQKPLHAHSLNHGDTFVVDAGKEIYVWRGNKSNMHEKTKAQQVAVGITSERPTAKQVVVDDGSEGATFWGVVGGDASEVQEAIDDSLKEPYQTLLWRLSDASGKMSCTQLDRNKDNKFTKAMLDKNDVFLLDTEKEVFVWVGSGASTEERRQAMKHAGGFISATGRPPHTSITRFPEGSESPLFWKALEG